MIDIFGGPTPNVPKPLIALEEMGLAYKRLPVDDILKGKQFTPEFLAISPNNRVPAMVDHDSAPPSFTDEERKLLFGQKG